MAIDGDAGDPACGRDEVQLYLDARYVSSIEAYARSMGWPTHRVGRVFTLLRRILTSTRLYRNILLCNNYKFISRMNNV